MVLTTFEFSTLIISGTLTFISAAISLLLFRKRNIQPTKSRGGNWIFIESLGITTCNLFLFGATWSYDPDIATHLWHFAADFSYLLFFATPLIIRTGIMQYVYSDEKQNYDIEKSTSSASQLDSSTSSYTPKIYVNFSYFTHQKIYIIPFSIICAVPLFFFISEEDLYPNLYFICCSLFVHSGLQACLIFKLWSSTLYFLENV